MRLDELTGDAVRMVLQLVANLGTLTAILEPEAVPPVIEEDAPRRAWDDLIRQRLEPADVITADDLREACAWLRAILSTTAITLGPAIRQGDAAAAAPAAQHLDSISNADIRRALRGDVRAFFRVDLVPIRRSDFEADRPEFGTLAQIATTSGRRVYAC